MSAWQEFDRVPTKEIDYYQYYFCIRTQVVNIEKTKTGIYAIGDLL